VDHLAGRTAALLVNTPGLGVGLLVLQTAQDQDHREARSLLLAVDQTAALLAAVGLLVGQTAALLAAETLEPGAGLPYRDQFQRPAAESPRLLARPRVADQRPQGHSLAAETFHLGRAVALLVGQTAALLAAESQRAARERQAGAVKMAGRLGQAAPEGDQSPQAQAQKPTVREAAGRCPRQTAEQVALPGRPCQIHQEPPPGADCPARAHQGSVQKLAPPHRSRPA
jgi:hypothetical protein